MIVVKILTRWYTLHRKLRPRREINNLVSKNIREDYDFSDSFKFFFFLTIIDNNFSLSRCRSHNTLLSKIFIVKTLWKQNSTRRFT